MVGRMYKESIGQLSFDTADWLMNIAPNLLYWQGREWNRRHVLVIIDSLFFENGNGGDKAWEECSEIQRKAR